MSYLKYLILLLVLSFSFTFMKAASPPNASSVCLKGEELTYEVSFYGIKLGSIKIVSEGFRDYNGRKVFKSKAFMKSYDGIPFVDLQSVYESWMHPSLKFSYKFTGSTKQKDDTWDYQKIMMNYKSDIINFEHWWNEKRLKKVEFETNKMLSDGSSLFFLSREMLYTKKTLKIPTILDTNVMYTFINFHARREESEIDAVDYPIKTVYFDGRAEWEGVYGLSGKFKGWFSDDEARVPIRAEMNVYVGVVDIELIEWKRSGWIPPKAN